MAEPFDPLLEEELDELDAADIYGPYLPFWVRCLIAGPGAALLLVLQNLDRLF